MAYASAYLFCIVMILSHELLSTQGRNMRERSDLPNCASCFSPDAINRAKGAKESALASPTELQRNIRTLEGYVEAFRPTTPGHSPGVGHSVHN